MLPMLFWYGLTPGRNRLVCPWDESTHWGRVTHLCFGNLNVIGSDNGLSSGRRQAIIGTNFSEMLIAIHTFSFKKIHLKMSSGKWRPFCLVLNVLNIPDYPGWFYIFASVPTLLWAGTYFCSHDNYRNYRTTSYTYFIFGRIDGNDLYYILAD